MREESFLETWLFSKDFSSKMPSRTLMSQLHGTLQESKFKPSLLCFDCSHYIAQIVLKFSGNPPPLAAQVLGLQGMHHLN